MSYRLIDSNAIAIKYPEVNEMSCVFANLPDGMNGQFIDAQPEPCEDTVSRKAVEKMLKNGFPARGMWEIEGDVVKNAICETVADLMMDLEKLPSAQPDIIQCRNCKFASGDSRICMKFGHSPIGELDFCSWAERRTDE